MTVTMPSHCPATLRTVMRLLVGNTLIASVLWLAGVNQHFADLWLLSQCIGCSIALIHRALRRFGPQRLGSRGQALLGVALGAALGVALASWLGLLPEILAQGNWRILLRVGAMALIIGTIAYVFFHNAQRVSELRIDQQAAQLRELVCQKEAMSAHLNLLQAQIEPHFLFNTLANLHSLIGANDALARRLLERLNDYLRTSLDHSRSASGTLGEDCHLLAAYLEIQALRMGQRLTWSIDVAPELSTLPLPPMLLQPLLENAIAHGIEPRVGAGCVTLAASIVQRRLHLSVSDDGQGLDAAARTAGGRRPGVGLTNVRERLAAIYGDEAELVLRENQPTGVIAELWIPLPALVH